MNRVLKFFLSFLLFVALCYVGLVWFVDREVGKGIDQAVEETPGMILTYGDLSVSITNHTVTLTDVEATLPDGRHLTAENIVITRFDQMNTVPYYLQAEATGAVLDVNLRNFGTWASVLNAAGFKKVTGDFAIDYSYDAKAEELTINRMDIRAPELGDLSLTGVINHLDLSAPRMEELLGLHMKDMTLSYDDHSLVTSLLESMARDSGVSAPALRARVTAELDAMAEYAGTSGNEVAEDALLGLKRFMSHPGSITISARPKEPVPYLYLFMGRDMYDNLRMLNVSVTTDASDRI